MGTRVKNAAATRENILDAARHRFLQESYENVGLRNIAADAGVDVALVGRYFGSKEELFKEVLRGTRGEWLDPSVSAADLPQWLAALATQKHCPGEREDIERLLIILRSASSSTPAEVVRQTFRANVLDPVANLLSGPDAETKASIALSLLMGTTILRTIMAVEPLGECDAVAVRARLTALISAALA
ncbi:MAG: TetR/AcrR family transcriptional regulator [Alphaproteobacteria bacterium]|nr:TetR/AcrR family transcriptional regulator [Alphaproteobacteria bacterium]